VDLPHSGRSTASIIFLANQLIDWTRDSHPADALREALRPPHIQPGPPDVQHPNPPDNPNAGSLMANHFEGDKEIEAVVRSLKKWLPDHPEATTAVLAPINERGKKVADDLRAAGLEVVELLRNSLPTRQIARILAQILRYLDDPSNKQRLRVVFGEVYPADARHPGSAGVIKAAENALKTCNRVESYLHSLASDWLEELKDAGVSGEVLSLLDQFRILVRRWQDAVLLPVDQLILTLSVDLFPDPANLALAHKLALVLEHDARTNPDWNLPRFALELESISRNQRRLRGFGY
jgi:DNA helicase-2/ATP-dependent DNA helicase PcrA